MQISKKFNILTCFIIFVMLIGGNISAAIPEITVTIYDKGQVPAAEGTVTDNRWTKWIDENIPEYDINYIAIPRYQSSEKLNTLFAGGMAPDLILEYSPTIRAPFYHQKLLMPIGDLIDEYSTEYKKLLIEYPALEKVGRMDDGKLYLVGKINEVNPLRVVLIREDWLDKLGLGVPKTLDEFFEVVKAFADKDPDGNGQDDTFGINLSGQASGTIDQFFQAFQPWIITEDGGLRYGLDRIEASLRFKKKIYDAGVIDRDFLTDSNGAKAKQDFVTGKLGIYLPVYKPYEFAMNEYATLKNNVPEARIIPIAYPETKFGSFNPTLNNPVQMTGMVYRGSKNPEAVIKYIDFMIKESTGMALTYGFEGEHYKMENGVPVIIDADKHKKEVGYTFYNRMLFTSLGLGKAGYQRTQFDISDSLQKEGLEIFEKANNIYLDISKPLADLTHSEHMPIIPKDLQIIQTNMSEPMDNVYQKAIISGDSYSVEEAMTEYKDIWKKTGGEKIEDWMDNWYRDNKDTAFLAKDIYQVLETQLELKKELFSE